MSRLGGASFLLLLLLGGCGSEAPNNNQNVDLPLPSGPPIAQQVDAVPTSAPEQDGPAWEAAAGGQGTALRLTEPGGRLLIGIFCVGAPPQLAVSAPGFDPVGSEDRFSFGLDNDPLTLVADPTRQSKSGVTGEGAVPEDFAARLQEAKQVSAHYGNQQLGPFEAPDEALKEALVKSCAGRK